MSQDGQPFRKSDLKQAGDVLMSLLKSKDSGLSEQFLRWRLWNSWADVAGKEIAEHSMPVGYVNGTLYVWVKSSARLQEMTFVIKTLLKKVNTYAGRNWVKSIRFTLDRKAVPQQQENVQGLQELLSKQSPNEDGEPQPDR